MQPPSISSYILWFRYLLVAAILLLFFRLGAPPVYILDEAKNAQCAREMWLRGDAIVPTFNGELRTDKPPLHYWVMMGSYALFGTGPLQARLGSALMGLFTLLIVFWIVRRLANSGVAFFTVLGLVLSAHFIFEFRLAVPDPYLIGFTTAGLLFGYSYLAQKNGWWLSLTALSLGLATLAKGPVALALPGLSFLLFIVWERRWKDILDLRLAVAAILVLILTLPWYLAVHRATGGAFTQGFFFEHNLSRFTNEMEGHGGFFLLVPLMVMVGLIPISIFIIPAFRRSFGFWKEPLFRFSVVVVAVYVAFFSISSTKLPNYAMPCYPFVCFIAGRYLYHQFSSCRSFVRWQWVVWMILSGGLSIGAWLGIGAESEVKHLAWLGWLLMLVPAGLCLAWWLQKLPLSRMGVWVATWLLIPAIVVWVAYPTLYNQNPVTQINQSLEHKAPYTLLAFRQYNPAFNFNNGKAYENIIPVYQNPDSLVFEARRIATQTQRPVFVVTRLNHVEALDTTVLKEKLRHRDLFELPTTVVFEWQAH